MTCFVPQRCISFISQSGPPIWLALAEASGQCQALGPGEAGTDEAWDFDLFHPQSTDMQRCSPASTPIPKETTSE